MKPEHQKLKHESQEETAQTRHQQLTSLQQGREFASVEEMLRHDSAKVAPPGQVAARLRESLANEPRPARPWWQRLFGRP